MSAEEHKQLLTELLTLVQGEARDSWMEVDFNGHFLEKSRPSYTEHLKSRLRLESSMHLMREPAATLRKIIARETFEPFAFELGFSLETCGECGAHLHATFDGKTVRVAEPCACPEGMPEFSMEIDIPSGKMVFANDLRRFYSDPPHDRPRGVGLTGSGYDLGTNVGTREESLVWAAAGMGYGYVGNSCPGIYKMGPNHFVIGRDGYELRDDGDVETPHAGKRIGTICTDLWWYSIGDDDYLKTKGYKPNKTYDRIVTVTPGRFRITHRTHCWNGDRKRPADFATIEHVP